ncbi:outer membrane beta-barrel protein [Hymenobacter crusticola]|uniref:Outer membrane protein beta-barrel domain-containing protein n=1 Tax=Hymenobacter crusticola TaxID=1770526 RepID=A0A243W4U4_9BACT|nr:outer membrane beta-barrel protein [Hymenobacter crusticola]OUJ66567.1 hypothetical protein BXP70_29015 [Hymenobacter crusticola]
MHRRLLCYGFLLLVRCSYGQSTPAPRFYAGTQAVVSRYAVFFSGESNAFTIASMPIQLVVGYRFAPRWAVQVGWVGTRQIFRDGSTWVNTAGHRMVSTSRNEQRCTAIPVLARYSLTRKSTHRFQFEVLGGVTLVHAFDHQEGLLMEDDQVSAQADKTRKGTNAVLSIGPGICYTLGRHLALVADYGYNMTVVTPSKRRTNGVLLSSLNSTFTGGLHYRFGYH